VHEFSVCRSLLTEVARVAERHAAQGVVSLTVAVGPLSGVEPGLLARAFTLARCGTIAQDAALHVERAPVKVRCRSCAQVTTAAAVNRLVCGRCGDFRTDLVSGDELMLLSVELECDGEGEEDGVAAGRGPSTERAVAET
jgi:hydrogenase nickel incorporation protein HypA/HybF